ncbi:related to MFS hexose transporter [Phialocephala subalpina]|uniref:Related to MFS hexose transporter n=1 Tax=Phialocephala subalpina TaxID=576137 RepID=A0A1L7WT14_9HELO|nr:related to MFS hexose transporter [Phialocephala subalpina]
MITSSSWGFDLSMTNGLQSVDRFMDHFDNPTGVRLGFYGACMSIGGIIGSIIGGPLAIMETWSKNLYMFAGAKLILGLGSNLQQVAGPVLVAELAHPKDRVTLTSLYNTSIYIGLIIGAWTTPRWYITKGHLEEARQILIKYHGNGVETDVVRAELQEIIAGVEVDKAMMKFNKDGIMSIIGTKGNRHHLWIAFWTAVGSQCLGSSLIASRLPQILDQVGLTTSKDKTLINEIMTIWNWVVALPAAFVIGRVARRKLFLFSTGGILCVFILWTAMAAQYLDTGKKCYGIAVVVLIFIFSFFSSICWIPHGHHLPLETVTTKQRGIFFAWTMFAINASAFVVSYINPIALDNISWRYYIIQCIFNFMVILIIYFTFVETHGMTLEEISVMFDGDEQFNRAAAAIGAELERKTSATEHANIEHVHGEVTVKA